MRCPNCQAKLVENAKFCIQCGNKIGHADVQTWTNQPMRSGMRQKHCTACGSPLLEGIKYCTVCGMSANQASPCLIRLRDNTRINIGSCEFKIGKKPELVDYCIADNRTISRIHAKIINRNGQFFVMDMGSTNHTYVNGTRIPSNVEVQIMGGARLRLSNEEFDFKVQ